VLIFEISYPCYSDAKEFLENILLWILVSFPERVAPPGCFFYVFFWKRQLHWVRLIQNNTTLKTLTYSWTQILFSFQQWTKSSYHDHDIKHNTNPLKKECYILDPATVEMKQWFVFMGHIDLNSVNRIKTISPEQELTFNTEGGGYIPSALWLIRHLRHKEFLRFCRRWPILQNCFNS